MNGKLLVGLAVAVGCVIAGTAVIHRRLSSPLVARFIDATSDTKEQDNHPASDVEVPSAGEIKSTALQVPKDVVSETAAPVLPNQPAATAIRPMRTAESVAVKPNIAVPPQNAGGKELTLPRMALSLVGADLEAEQIWTLAINDPSRDPNDRKNLIEDLNEDGFPDPKHVTVDDVPLILSRIELIEQLAPTSMDEVNAAAFGEAYKDLLQMLDRLATQ